MYDGMPIRESSTGRTSTPPTAASVGSSEATRRQNRSAAVVVTLMLLAVVAGALCIMFVIMWMPHANSDKSHNPTIELHLATFAWMACFGLTWRAKYEASRHLD